MNELRLPARIYLSTLTAGAIGLTLLALGQAGMPGTKQTLLAVVFVALMAVVVAFPIQIAHKTKFMLDISVAFAGVLLFDTGIAMLVIGLGSAIGYIVTRREADEVIFNSSQLALEAGAGSLILLAGGWNHDAPQYNDPVFIASIPVVAAAMLLINQATVATIVGLQTGQPILLVWRGMLGFDVAEQVTQVAVGLLAAAIASNFPWMLPFLLIPILPVYRSTERHVQLRTQTLNAVESMADIVDIRDPYTANHSRRVAEYSRELATELGLAREEVDLIERAARVHDIGKIVVELSVLLKDGKLTDEEFDQIKKHPATGAEILSRFPQFALATSYVRSHHERLDGKGYPDRLTGDQIPFGAKIIAVADSFDAMVSDRPYRAGLPLDVVLGEMRKHSGTQWDEQVVNTLLTLVEREQIVVRSSQRAAAIQVAA